MIRRLLRTSLKSNLRLGSYIAVCFTLITETNTIPIIEDLSQRVSGKHDLNRVASSRLMKVPAIDTKLTPKQPLDKKHILLKELFKTARHLYIGKGEDWSQNPLVLDLNLKTLDNMLLDINPMINSKYSDKGKCS